MQYKSVKVKTPQGVRNAELTSETKNGYRAARLWIGNERIRGRISSRHGFKDGRVLTFEVLSNDAHMFYAKGTFVTQA